MSQTGHIFIRSASVKNYYHLRKKKNNMQGGEKERDDRHDALSSQHRLAHCEILRHLCEGFLVLVRAGLRKKALSSAFIQDPKKTTEIQLGSKWNLSENQALNMP